VVREGSDQSDDLAVDADEAINGVRRLTMAKELRLHVRSAFDQV
jgi:hypothetical protein